MVSPGRIMARLALVIGASLLISGYSSCSFVSNTGGTSDAGSGFGQEFSTTLALRDSVGAASNSFVMGEPIRFELEIENEANRAATLRFPDSQIYDFYVLDAAGSRVHWRWSEGMQFDPAAARLQFAPQSTKAYSVTWNGVLGDGTQLPAGNYRARGVIVAEDFSGDPMDENDLASNPVFFTVR